MEIKWSRRDGFLELGNTAVKCSCDVKNELNGRRKGWQVVHGELADGSEGPPYMPRQFPIGRWKVVDIVPRTHPYLRPFFISTDAWQEMPEWEVREGLYVKPNGKSFIDYGYGLHCSESPTTLGCIRIDNDVELNILMLAIRNAWAGGDTVTLYVEE